MPRGQYDRTKSKAERAAAKKGDPNKAPSKNQEKKFAKRRQHQLPLGGIAKAYDHSLVEDTQRLASLIGALQHVSPVANAGDQEGAKTRSVLFSRINQIVDRIEPATDRTHGASNEGVVYETQDPTPVESSNRQGKKGQQAAPAQLTAPFVPASPQGQTQGNQGNQAPFIPMAPPNPQA